MSENGHGGEINEQIFTLLNQRFDSLDKKVDDGFARTNGNLLRHDEKLNEHDEHFKVHDTWMDRRSGIEMVLVWIIPIGISIAIALMGRYL